MCTYLYVKYIYIYKIDVIIHKHAQIIQSLGKGKKKASCNHSNLTCVRCSVFFPGFVLVYVHLHACFFNIFIGV